MGDSVQSHAPAAIPPGKRTGTHCTVGWASPTAGLDGWGKSRPHQNSIPEPLARNQSLSRLRYHALWQNQQGRQRAYNITLRHVRATTVALENKHYIFWVCVCSLRYKHHIVICRLHGSKIFFHIIPEWHDFMGGGELLNIRHVFWISLQLLSAAFLILRRTGRDRVKRSIMVFM